MEHLRRTNGDLGFQLLPGPYSDHITRWKQYCHQAERNIRGDDEDTLAPSVFGVCRRCGSTWLLVTTRQLRRADEGIPRATFQFLLGMAPLPGTEVRQCKECGHVSKVNS